MAGQKQQSPKDWKGNVITYEFQGDMKPLSEAIGGARKLFKRYVKEIKEAEGATRLTQLSDDIRYSEREIRNNLGRLKEYTSKTYLGEEDIIQSQRIFRKLRTEIKNFEKERTKIRNQSKRKEAREEKKERQTHDYTSISSQFKAQVQADQLGILLREAPGLDPKVISDVNSYVEAWRRAKREFDNGTGSVEDLSDATEALDKKARAYIPTLTKLKQQQKGANTVLESMAYRLASCITSLEFLISKIKEGFELLGDYVESINYLDVAINDMDWTSFITGVNDATDAINNFKDALDQARWSLGLDATDLNTSAATFISFANASNIAAKNILTFSQNMTQLTIDMASLHNKDVSVMLTSFRSALAGNTRSMMNYGVSVHDATLEEWLLTKGINRSMSSMSESSQVLVRYAYLMETLTSAQGDMAKTLKSPSNQLKVLRNQVTLLLQNLGALFNTIIYPMIRIINEVLTPLNAFITALTSLATEDYSASIGSVEDAVDGVTDSLESASNAAVGLTDLDEINVSSTTSSNITGIDPEIQALVDGLGVYEGFAGTTSRLTELMQSLGNALAPIWEMFANTSVLNGVVDIFNALLWVLYPIQLALDAIKLGYENSPSWLQSIFNVISSIVGAVTSLTVALIAVNVAMKTFKKLTELGIWKNFTKSIAAMWTAFLELGKSIYTAIAKMVTWIATTIKARIEALKTAVAQNGLAATLKMVALNALKAVASLAKYIVQLIAAGAKAVVAAIKNLILSKSLWGVALGAIAAAGIAALAVAGVVGVAVAIGKATQNSNQATESTIGLATGGVVSKPTFAMIGEGKYNEAVVPLGNSPQFTSMKESIADSVINKQKSTSNNYNSFNGSSSQSVILNIDGRTLGRMQLNSINKVRRQVGVDLK